MGAKIQVRACVLRVNVLGLPPAGTRISGAYYRLIVDEMAGTLFISERPRRSALAKRYGTRHRVPVKRLPAHSVKLEDVESFER
jgi:hypothetical protein